jgi:hypothetical protein
VSSILDWVLLKAASPGNRVMAESKIPATAVSNADVDVIDAEGGGVSHQV